MALSDLAVFNEFVRSTKSEELAQNVERFNAASLGAISLKAAANEGDYSDETMFQKISGLVRRRNAYGSGAVSKKVLVNITDTMVKVAAGTPPVEINPGMFKWIQQDPKVAGAVIGAQLAKDAMADMLNTSLLAAKAAFANVGASVVLDATGLTPDTLTSINMNNAAYKFGDAVQDIVAWVIHSTPMRDFYNTALGNDASLFSYGTINVMADPFGRRFIVTDSPALVTAGSPNIYHNLGLVTGGIRIEENNDFTENVETSNGDENILRTYQAEWSFNLGIKGYAWDKTNGSHSPTDSALATGTNWDKFATSIKDTAGVLLETN